MSESAATSTCKYVTEREKAKDEQIICLPHLNHFLPVLFHRARPSRAQPQIPQRQGVASTRGPSWRRDCVCASEEKAMWLL